MSVDRYRVIYASGSRADYGIVRRYLSLLDSDESISLGILATGSLLDDEYGHAVDLIEKDGFEVVASIPSGKGGGSTFDILSGMGECLSGAGRFFADEPCDLLIVLGDRFEIYAVATAAAMQRVPILHIHGGEATYGNYDEFLRHAITKMSRYHFTATEAYRKRVLQLGESKDCVWNLGALGAENCLMINTANVPDEIKTLTPRSYYVFLFHPETLTGDDAALQTRTVLAVADELTGEGERTAVFLGSNSDNGSDVMRTLVREYVGSHYSASFFVNLHPDAYHYLVKNSLCLIGNSSSGLIEAPSLGVYTVNIGSRQDGRERGESVFDVPWDTGEIVSAAKRAQTAILDDPGVSDRLRETNPYAGVDTSARYYETTLEILKRVKTDKSSPKIFASVPFKD